MHSLPMAWKAGKSLLFAEVYSIQTVLKLLLRTLKRGRKHSKKGFKDGGRIFRNLITATMQPKYIGTISQAITEVVMP